MIERRKYPRFEIRVDAKYKIMSCDEVFSLGKTRNISAEGICFESDRSLKPGACVNLEVDLKDKNKPVSLVGQVIWSQGMTRGPGMKEKIYLNGIKLVDIPKSDEGRFLKYYCDRMVEKLSGYLKM